MESYSLTVTDQNVKIVRDKEYWRLEGISHISIQSVEKYLTSIELIVKDNDISWYYDNCIELYILHKEGLFQGIEIKGCLVYFDEGIKLCYNLLMNFQKILLIRIHTY